MIKFSFSRTYCIEETFPCKCFLVIGNSGLLSYTNIGIKFRLYLEVLSYNMFYKSVYIYISFLLSQVPYLFEDIVYMDLLNMYFFPPFSNILEFLICGWQDTFYCRVKCLKKVVPKSYFLRTSCACYSVYNICSSQAEDPSFEFSYAMIFNKTFFKTSTDFSVD